MLLLNLIAAATFAVVIQQTTSFSGLRCHLATHALSRRMLSAKAGLQHHHRGVLRLYSTKVKEDFSALLEDLMYSGELETLLKRNSKRIFQESFMNFLADKLTSADDEDEIEMMKDIQQRVGQKLKETGGDMAVELVYDTRLDKIAFTAPKLRRKYITDNIHEMTDGFILHVQRLLQEIPDEESKIVLASILQMIGQAKKIDLLGQYSTLLNKNDQDLLEGNVQNLNENLEQSAIVGNRNEQILAGLMFSKNNVIEDVLNNLHVLDDSFIKFLENKIDKTEDIEERGAFTSLLTTIQEVMERVKAMEGEQMQVEDDREATIEEISARMREVQLGHEIVKGSMEKKEDSVFAVKEDKRKTFLSILQKFQQIPVDKTLLQIVEQYYDLCDYEFMETLAKEATDCEQLNNAEDADKYRTLIATINEVMLKKVGSAQQKLQRILSRKELKLMEAEAALLTRKGEADEALVLLIEANAQQAKQAGALPAYEILTKIAKKIIYEQERRLPEEQQLLRALMRLEDSEQRKGLLYDAFKPRKDTNENAEIIELPPTIAPPVFINIVRQFIRNFGNIDGFQIMDRALAIIDEAQVVATEFYGEGMNAQQQQKYMFEKNTVSVWDLGNYEDQALLSGEEIPWENNAFDNKGPEDVVGERVKSIGGIHDSL